jgi:hypothetical protein
MLDELDCSASDVGAVVIEANACGAGQAATSGGVTGMHATTVVANSAVSSGAIGCLEVTESVDCVFPKSAVTRSATALAAEGVLSVIEGGSIVTLRGSTMNAANLLPLDMLAR